MHMLQLCFCLLHFKPKQDPQVIVLERLLPLLQDIEEANSEPMGSGNAHLQTTCG
jgi:hypothetical protein